MTLSGAEVGELILVEIGGKETCKGARLGLPEAEVGVDVGGV